MSANEPWPQGQRENPDPHEAKNPVPPLYLVLFGIIGAVGFTYLAQQWGHDLAFSGDQRSVLVSVEQVELSGEAIYAAKCAACHQASGLGVPKAFPPLVDSPWLLEDKETPIRIVLEGLEGEIEVSGVTYDGTMPHFKDQLSDAEVARVLTHERASWGNHAAAISEDDVRGVRASLAGRSGPWKGGAELTSARAAKTP